MAYKNKPRPGRSGRDPREKHVRIYGYEMQSEAYRSLSTDARSLLLEFRYRFNGGENRIPFSVREMAERLGRAGQRRIKKACDQLLDRGFIELAQPGSFHRKTRHASEFYLLNEPIGDQEPRKDYMRWKKPRQSK
jgi:hypothetical protein